MFTNNLEGKKWLTKALAEIYEECHLSIKDIELKAYRNKQGHTHEFIVLTWTNGAISTAPNDMNSLSATARNIARMLDGGVYERLDFYKEIMKSEEWEEL